MPNNRVLVVADFDVQGGTGTFLRRLLGYLAPRYEVHFAFRPGSFDREMGELLSRLGCSFSRDGGLGAGLEDFLARFFRRLRIGIFYQYCRDSLVGRYLEIRHRPRLIVISQGNGYSHFAFLTSKRPVVMMTHSLFSDSIRTHLAGGMYARFFGKAEEGTKRICTVSKAAQSLFQRNIHSPRLSAIVTCIPNYGENFAFDRSSGGTGAVVVLTMGYLVDYKNPHLWMAVAKEARNRFKDRVRFVWAGDGTLLGELRKEAGPESGIDFPGFVKDTRTLYRSADIYFQPSLAESQGMAVVDALAASLPCVVSSAGGLPESVSDGVEGYVCDISSVEQYLAALSRLVENRDLRESMGRAARKKYESHFSQEAWESRMDEVLGEVTRRKHQ
ncbi:MAG TPA: glycosyltransferase family 4 protein [Rectinemataceae bacterium]|nr:glycosyltransferase family 4 protein [Rectinemataceae bacterium]